MTVEAQKFISSRYGLDFAYLIGRYTPSPFGHRIAEFAADFISSRKTWKIVQAARLNQWVARGEKLDRDALKVAVRENFRCTARSIFDLYHNINNPTSFDQMIDAHQIADNFLDRPEFSERGVVVVALHMGNFDFIGQAAAMAGVKAMYLGLANMNPHYQKQLEMRKQKGMNFVPTSRSALKEAIRYLERGGMVVTGIDRPDDSLPYRPDFFGHPAALPVHSIFLALSARVPVMVGCVISRQDGRYHPVFSEPIEMQTHPDRRTEMLVNAEKVLQIAEGYILQAPSQWAMTFPIWPDLMDQVPR